MPTSLGCTNWATSLPPKAHEIISSYRIAPQNVPMSPEENDIMRSVEDHYWWYQALRPHVAAAIEPAAPDFSLLDAGCGTGGMLNVVRQKFPAADLTGVDQSTHALELTAARQTGAKLIPASVQQL